MAARGGQSWNAGGAWRMVFCATDSVLYMIPGGLQCVDSSQGLRATCRAGVGNSLTPFPFLLL